MLITCHGHSEFLIETGNVYRILTDPFDAHVGYPMRETEAELVLVSHGHGDHAFTEKVKGSPRVIDKEGEYCPAPGIGVTAILSDHDDQGGAQRGKTLLFLVEAEGLRIAHLGDLGRPLTGEEVRRLGRVDILMLPVGGFFTIDAAQAAEVCAALRPRVVLPMHYKTGVNASWPIAEVTPFLKLMGRENAAPMPLVRITAGDLSEQPPLCLLSAAQ